MRNYWPTTSSQNCIGMDCKGELIRIAICFFLFGASFFSLSDAIACDGTIVLRPTTYYRETKSRVKFSAEGGSGVISVLTDCDWTAKVEYNYFVQISETSGSGDGEIHYSVFENTGELHRRAQITVSTHDHEMNYSIWQAGTANPKIVLETERIPETGLVRQMGYVTYNFKIFNNGGQPLTYSIDESSVPDWITLERLFGENILLYQLNRVTVWTNNIYENRSCSIKFINSNDPSDIAFLYIFQEGISPDYQTFKCINGNDGNFSKQIGDVGGQCPIYVKDETGINDIFATYAFQYFAKSQELGYATGNCPMVGALVVFDQGKGMTAGHIAIVKEINGDQITLRHSNWMVYERVSEETFTDLGDSYLSPGGTKTYPILGYIYCDGIVRDECGSGGMDCTDSVLAERERWDANGDNRIGLQEAIKALQVVAGIRDSN